MEQFSPNILSDIADFHAKFGFAYPKNPTHLSDQMLNFRVRFLEEELAEYKDASIRLDGAGMLDALVDLVYVALGTAYLHGFNFAEAWRRVHAANMAKVRAESADQSKRGTAFDVVKPEGWQAPDHSDLVAGMTHYQTANAQEPTQHLEFPEIQEAAASKTKAEVALRSLHDELNELTAKALVKATQPEQTWAEYGQPELIASKLSTDVMLKELAARGGHPGALAESALLCIRKSQDYNNDQADLNPHEIDRSSYFPFGAVSYAQMLHTKSQRFNSLVMAEQVGREPNFEGLADTARDIINYAGFFLADKKVSA